MEATSRADVPTRSFPEWITVTEYIESDTPRLASDEDELRPRVFSPAVKPTPLRLSSVGRDDSLDAHHCV